MTEEVLVVPRARLLSEVRSLPAGFQRGGVDAYLDAVAIWGRFVPRPAAERDPLLKQIIPYCVVQHGGDVFLMRRTRAGVESRLHDKLSLGVGGHINPVDVPGDGDLRRTVERALRREIHEELRVDGPARLDCLGVLNDDSNAVGRVHLGFVYQLLLARRDARVREARNLEGDFIPASSLESVEGRMETWSGILARSLFVEPPPE